MRPSSNFSALVLVGLALVGASGCEERVDAALLHVDGLDVERLEAGTLARIDGRGFPTGRRGRVRLRGLAHRPGEPPLRVEAEARARAESDGRLFFECDETTLARLGGRGTFVGALRVEFAGEGGAVVSGELSPVTLTIRPGGLGELSGVLDRERRGMELLAELGIRGDAEADERTGVAVESLAPGSAADLGGVHKRDRIVALGAMRVDDVGDLVPPPRARSVELVLERPGLSQPVRALVSLEPTVSGPSARSIWGATIAFALAFVLLLLVSPLARGTTRFWRALRATKRPLIATILGLDPLGHDASLLRRAMRAVWIFVAFVALVVAFGVLPFTVRMLPGTIDAAVLVAATIGLAAAVRAASRPREGAGRRLAGVVWTVAASAPAIVAVSAIALPIGTFQIEAISAAQSGEPWGFAGLSTVAGILGLPAAFISLVVVPSRVGDAPSAQVLNRVRLFVGASLFTVVYLGGFSLPFLATDPLSAAPVLRVGAALFFVLKALTVVVVGLRIARVAPGVGALTLSSAASALAAAGAAGLLTAFPTVAPPPQVVGPVATVAASIVLIAGLVTSRSARAPTLRGVAIFS